jgi:hypothetical protein
VKDEPSTANNMFVQPALYEQVNLSANWTGFQEFLCDGERLPSPLAGHRWICIDQFRSLVTDAASARSSRARSSRASAQDSG